MWPLKIFTPPEAADAADEQIKSSNLPTSTEGGRIGRFLDTEREIASVQAYQIHDGQGRVAQFMKIKTADGRAVPLEDQLSPNDLVIEVVESEKVTAGYRGDELVFRGDQSAIYTLLEQARKDWNYSARPSSAVMSKDADTGEKKTASAGLDTEAA